MTPIEAIQLTISVVLAVVTIRQARVTHELERRLYKLNTNLDQSIQRLHRAREAVIEIHKAKVFLIEYVTAYKNESKTELTDTYFQKQAEASAYAAELRGLAFAIGDEQLLSIVNNFPVDKVMPPEMQERARAQHLHTRISQLLLEATADAPTGNQNTEDWRTV